MRKLKGMAFLLSIASITVMSIGSCFAAARMERNAENVSVNNTIVGFAGYEWWVIGDSKGNGVYSKDGSITLLSKNSDFDATEFRKGSADKEDQSWTQYDDKWYYEGNFTQPTNYKDSTLQNKMESIANGLPAKERVKINSRTLKPDDDLIYPITGEQVENQKLWALSLYEGHVIYNQEVIFYEDDFWLRSAPNDTWSWICSPSPDSYLSAAHNLVYRSDATTRPALSLNLTSAVFTSNAKGAGSKASSTTESGLIAVSEPDTTKDGKIKYTFVDDSLKLGNVYVSSIKNNEVTVKYSGATAGKTLSAIIENSTGDVTHYGKLVDSTSTNGEASLQLPNNFNPATDKIEVFVEEINGENSSDFASTPKALDMTVKNLVTVSGGDGSGLYAKDAEITVTASPAAEGKRFKQWEISPAVQLAEGSSLTNETIVFTMPDEEVTATAVYEDIQQVIYPVKNGGNTSWQQGNGNGLTITSEGDIEKFTGVTVNGNMLDSTHYDAVSGSTIITLNASYLSTLPVGEHVVNIHFTDGYTETKFIIEAEQTNEPNPPVQSGTTATTTVTPVGTSPKTSDSNMIWIMVSLMLAAGIGFMVVSIVKQSKSK